MSLKAVFGSYGGLTMLSKGIVGRGLMLSKGIRGVRVGSFLGDDILL